MYLYFGERAQEFDHLSSFLIGDPRETPQPPSVVQDNQNWKSALGGSHWSACT